MNDRSLLPTLVAALAVVLGAQLLRVMVPSIGWYLSDTIGLGSIQLLPFALTPFLLAFAAPLLARVVGHRNVLLASGTGLGAARLIEQVSTDPAIDLWVSLAGVVCFLWFLAMVPASRLALGVMLGLAIDTALKGLTGTLDLSWIGGWGPILVVGSLVALLTVLLWRGRMVEGGAGGIGLVGVGPLLFVHWLVLQNQGWLAAVTGWSPGVALLGITLANALAVAGLLTVRWVPRQALALALLPAVIFVEGPAVLFAIAVFVAIVASGPLLAALAGSTGGRGQLALGVGWLLFVVLLFSYYAAMDIRLPFPREAVPVAAVVLVLLAAMPRIRIGAGAREMPRWQPVIAVPLVLAAVVVIGAEQVRPAIAAPAGYPVRVMVYNIHSAYGAEGRQNVEAIAQVIEEADADIVALQEISRGWLLNGSTDLVPLLADRLGMPYSVFHGTNDPVWGLAVLSRFPITDVERGLLPRMGTLIGRGYLAVSLDIHGDTMTVVNTHLSNVHDPQRHALDPHADLAELHAAQLGVVLDAWDGRPRSIVLGDMNAEPGWSQIELVLEAGFRDAWDAGAGPGYTSTAANPWHRIDWIFHTPDLVPESAAVIQSLASDHLPVVVTLRPAP